MLSMITCLALLAGSEPEAPRPDVTRAYQEARAKATRSPEDQVRLALWAEAHGLTTERLNHLALAVLADPKNAAARGLMGLVSHEGKWQRPEAVADKAQADPVLTEYQAIRARTPYTADGQWSLGVWADEHGLKDQARAHLTAVVRLDPARDNAWKRLGYRSHDGRWLTEDQWSAERAEAEAQKRADRKWRPILEDWRRKLGLPEQREAAEAKLVGLVDPRAVPSILRVFGSVVSEQSRAVQLLGQIDAPPSSRALAVLAVAAPSGSVRRSATETLRGRDPREYAELLIRLLADPVRFEVKHLAGLDSPGEILVEGKQVNVRRVYQAPNPFQAGDQLGVNDRGERVIFRSIGSGTSARASVAELSGDFANAPARVVGSGILSNNREVQDAIRLVMANPGLPPSTQLSFRFSDIAEIPVGQMLVEVQKSNVATEKQLRDDVRLLEDYNVGVRIGNDRASGVLKDATGQSVAADRRAWTRWYVDRVGYASPSAEWTARVAVTQTVAIDYQPPILPENSTRQIIGYDRVDCFAAGTPVQTIAGPRPIESLEVGDRVLTQSTVNGALRYQPVLAVHHNPALPTCQVKLKGQVIVASHVHRFWVAGRGWVLARDLKPGDPVRTLGGIAPIESVDPDRVQPVFNLDMAEDADYFAGTVAALVHDNTLPDPRLVPFDSGTRGE